MASHINECSPFSSALKEVLFKICYVQLKPEAGGAFNFSNVEMFLLLRDFAGTSYWMSNNINLEFY